VEKGREHVPKRGGRLGLDLRVKKTTMRMDQFKNQGKVVNDVKENKG